MQQSTADETTAKQVIGQRSPERFVPALVLATVVALAAWYLPYALELANADALLPALMSTQHWTLFYWGQDRLANLVPLVAMPVRDELQNVYVQTLIFAVAFFGLIALIVIVQANERLRRTPLLLAAAIAASGVLVTSVMFTQHTAYTFVVEQVYALSAVLFVAGPLGLTAGSNRRRLGGAAAMLAAVLLNPSVALYVVIAIALLPFDERFRSRALRLFIATSGAFVVTWICMRLFPAGKAYQSSYNEFSLARSLRQLDHVWSNIDASLEPTAWYLLAIGVIVQFGCWRRLTWVTRRLCVIAPVFSLCWLVLFAGNAWIEEGFFNFRYFFPVHATLMFFVIGAIVQIVQAVEAVLPERLVDLTNSLRAVTAAAVVALAIAAVGLGRIASGVEILTVNAARPDAEAARANEVQLIVGDYWSVWPAVVVGRDQGLDLYGVTYRSVVLRDRIVAIAERATEQPGGLRVVCTGMSVEWCAETISEITGQQWIPGELIQQSPVVITMLPGDPRETLAVD